MTISSPGSLLAYNPDLVAKDDLIRGFVARRPLLDRLVDDIRREVGPGSAQHHLIIGQRGTGKTTLLRRLAYAIQDSPEISTRWMPIIFPEEQYNVTDLSSFWLNCVDALGDVLDQQGRVEMVEALDRDVKSLSADPNRRREGALRLLVDTSEKVGKRLLLLVDNVDIILDRIGQAQEWEFRRALQEQTQLLLVGASSRVLEQAHEHGRAFYEFFRIHELGALDDNETLAVLRALAEQNGAQALCKLLDECPGRIRAMRLLTGGSPRTIVLLFKVLLQAPDGDLETDLQQLLDHYTPLYKARLEDLPPQAQVLVDAIAVHWDPLTAGDLADIVHLPVNAVSAQLNRLEVLGVTERTPWYGEKKNAFQIAERFFNIWYLMRGSRRVRRRLVWFVKFLQTWFSEEELCATARNHLASQARDANDDVGWQAALAHSLVARGAWEEARPGIENWARSGSADHDGIALVRAIVDAGHHKEVIAIMKKADAHERLRPLYLALLAVDAGSPDYLRRVAPEVRTPARSLYNRITGGSAPSPK